MNNSKPLLIIQKSHNFKDDRITMKSVDVYSSKKSYQITNSKAKFETAFEYNSRIEWIVSAIPNPIIRY